jgi:hypothetical protein
VRTREDCEAEITAALATFRLAAEIGDDKGAEVEEAHMNALIEEYDHIPQQRRGP